MKVRCCFILALWATQGALQWGCSCSVLSLESLLFFLACFAVWGECLEMPLWKRQFKSRVVALLFGLFKCYCFCTVPTLQFAGKVAQSGELQNLLEDNSMCAQAGLMGNAENSNISSFWGWFHPSKAGHQRRYILRVRAWGWGYCWGVQNALKYVCLFVNTSIVVFIELSERPGSYGLLSRLCEEVSCWSVLQM